MKLWLSTPIRVAVLLTICMGSSATLCVAGSAPAITQLPVLTMDGGRRLELLAEFSSEQDFASSRSFWKKAFDLVAGRSPLAHLDRPYGITCDSRGRVIVTDPGSMTVHIFDLEKKRYRRIERGKGMDFLAPVDVAVDAADNIYITDGLTGRIFVFDPEGKFRRFIGGVSKSEGYFKRPTGIAIDKVAGEIYVADTLRNKVYVLDLNGKILREFGERGTGPGQFNFPTEIVLHGSELYVVDAMNFRVQIFAKDGRFLSEFGHQGGELGSLFRPKGLSIDSEGNIYLADAAMEVIQVFAKDGALLYSFGGTGTAPGQMQLPAGVWIDPKDRVFVVDSFNQRIQMYQFTSAALAARGKK